jgi:hypothetical protein
MGNAGLLLVGAVLFVNGISSLGLISSRSTAPLNLLVGLAQVVLPTLVMVQAAGDSRIIDATWPSYLFGFTYLWYGLISLTDIDSKGFGWYSAFVAAVAVYKTATTVNADPISAVMWLTWAIMWAMFFLQSALGVTRAASIDLGRFTGWLLVLLGIPSCTVPALFLFNGTWARTQVAGISALAALVGLSALSAILARPRVVAAADHGAPPLPERIS